MTTIVVTLWHLRSIRLVPTTGHADADHTVSGVSLALTHPRLMESIPRGLVLYPLRTFTPFDAGYKIWHNKTSWGIEGFYASTAPTHPYHRVGGYFVVGRDMRSTEFSSMSGIGLEPQ